MNNNPKDSLDYSKAQLEDFSENTILEVMPLKTEEPEASKYVLIKHDYYSSDSNHGRDMLGCILSGLAESSFNSLIICLVDKGVLLLDDSNPLNKQMQMLIDKSEMVIVDEDSSFLYGIQTFENAKVSLQSFKSISEDIIYSSDILILE